MYASAQTPFAGVAPRLKRALYVRFGRGVLCLTGIFRHVHDVPRTGMLLVLSGFMGNIHPEALTNSKKRV